MSSTLLSAADGKALSEALQRDPGFWPALIRNPKAAYQAKFGKELLPGQEIEVVQDGPDRVTFVIPATGLRLPVQYSAATGELSDEQLEAVAGGVTTGAGSMPGGTITATPVSHASNPVAPVAQPVASAAPSLPTITITPVTGTFEEVTLTSDTSNLGKGGTQVLPGQAAIFSKPADNPPAK